MAGLDDLEWLMEQCAERSASSIARELGVAQGTVLRAMRLHGVPVRFATSPRRPDPVAELNDPDWLGDQYARKSAETIGAELEVHPSRVRRALSVMASRSVVVETARSSERRLSWVTSSGCVAST